MAKYSAYGTQLKRVAAIIANVSKISGPGLSLDTIDATSHDSTNAWEEVVAGILRSGEVTLDLVYDPNSTTHNYSATGLLGDMVARTAVVLYSLVFPSTPVVTWTFYAFVTGFTPDAPHAGGLTATAKLKLTGQPTLV